MTPTQEQAIRKHGVNLQQIFPATRDRDPVKLCKALRRLEVKADALAVRACNGEGDTGYTEGIKKAVDKILDFTGAGVPVFVNTDPRGYSLKIEDEWLKNSEQALHRDWGGYGIIAPEIDREGF